MKYLVILAIILTYVSNATWNSQTSFTSEKLNDVYMNSSNGLIYLVGDNAKMFRSTNMGSSWTAITSNLVTSNITSVEFIQSNVSFITTQQGRVFRSLDSGKTFERLFTSNDNKRINHLYYVHTSNTLIVGEDGTYKKSTNQGSSWDSIPYNFNNLDLNYIAFNGIHNGVIVGESGAVFNTTNGGNNWTSRTITGVSENLNCVSYSGNGSIFVAVGDNGRIVRTTNNGQNWQTVTSNVNANLNSIYFTPNSNIAFIVGDGGVILRSSNAGQSWSQQTNSNTNNLNTVVFETASLGYAFGDNGVFLKTLSGGLNQSITLDAPEANTTWIIGNQVQINWSHVSVQNVNIEISRDNQNSWGTLASNIPADNLTYNWTVTNPSSDEVFIRISDASNPGLVSVSGKFRITDFNLEITSPIANEEVNINSTKKITWNSQNVNLIDIYYSINNGSSWNLIAEDIQASLGEYDWTTPNSPTVQARIKIESSSNPSQYVVSSPFSIIGDNLTLLNTNGGNFDAGDQINIQWQSQNVNRINIDYSTNGGVSWTNIVTNYPTSNNQYSWIVPYRPGQAQIRITSAENPNLFDISEPSFTIRGFDLTILNPLGGSYRTNTNLNIQWAADSRIQFVKIDYSTNGGTTWNLIKNNVTASLGSYIWTTPNQASSNYKIRLTDNTGNIVKTSNVFSVTSLKIISPANNSTLIATNEYEITWEAIGFSNVNLLYSTNNGNSWVNIATNVLASQGEIDWPTPDINQSVILKIENAADVTQFHTVNLNIEQSALEITSPQANLFYRSGQNINIEWNANLVEYVDLSYSVGGGPYSSIATNVMANQGSYTWTAPVLESNQVIVRIENSNNNQIFDESDEFGISDDIITILSPNGNEIWNQGEVREIRWTVSDAVLVDIELSTDMGQTWQIIDSDVDASQPYDWTIGKVPTQKAWIRVTDSNKPGISDITDASFRINGLDLLSPNGGETYLLSTTEQITWKSVGMTNINIYYSDNEGITWREIVRNYPASSGFYNWNIPAITGDKFRIRVIDPTKTNFEDFSASNFFINGIKITSPRAGEQILFGTQYPITFDKYDIQNVKIEHSTDNGQTWYTVISHHNATSGMYLWDVPEMPGTQNKLKVTSIEVPTLFDVTANPFTILEQGVVVTSPNGNEVLNANSSETITWASANIDNVKIEYSDNDGDTWNEIVASTDAANRYYVWNTPNINGDEYLIRITDTKIEELTDVSNSNFSIDGGVYILPDEWDYTLGTGRTSHIIIPSTVTPIIGSVAVENGDVIGVFYTSGNTTKCAGYAVYDSDDMAITVWGDNTLTSTKDGYAINEAYKLKVWDESTGVVYDATVTYSSGFSYFTENGISIVSKFETQRPLSIDLEGGTWQMISSNLQPVNTALSSIFSNVLNDIEYVKNTNGQLYYPDQNINQISSWVVTEGYQIYSNNDATLNIIGNTVTPANYSYTFNANRWYMISYLPSDIRNVSSVFSNLTNLILVKNDDGEVYYPAFGINQIGNMEIGEGYQLAVSQNNQTFAYTNNPIAPPAPVIPGIFAEEEEKYYQTEISKTGNSAVVIFNNTADWYGEIGIFDTHDRLIGHGLVNGVYTSITIWGDNPITFEKDGAREQEKLRIEFYDYNTKSIQKIAISQIFEMMSSKDLGTELKYTKDAIYNIEATKVISNVTDNLTSISLYPNPAKDIVYMNISGEGNFDVEVYDISGSLVYSKEHRTNGQSTIKLDISNLRTGSYIIKTIGRSSIYTQKFIKIE